MTAPSPTAIPPVTPEAQLICGNLATLAERVKCRLGLADDILERELTIRYLPEECRAMPEGDGRTTCIERYRNLRPCWTKPIGAERLACVRGILGLGELQAERAVCAARIGADQLKCLSDLHSRAYPYITFRFDDLERRAEKLIKMFGAPLDLVATFVTQAEQAKINFNAARTKEERVAIIRRLQSAWRGFIAQLAEEVKQRARS